MQCASCGADPLQEDKSSDVVDEIGHVDLHLGALDADCAGEEPHSGLLIGEDMLDAGADHRLAGIGAACWCRHLPDSARLYPGSGKRCARVKTAAVGPGEVYHRYLMPKWAFMPTSGAGAAMDGGRFNRPGIEALYLSRSPQAALEEYRQGASITPPATLDPDNACRALNHPGREAGPASYEQGDAIVRSSTA